MSDLTKFVQQWLLWFEVLFSSLELDSRRPDNVILALLQNDDSPVNGVAQFCVKWMVCGDSIVLEVLRK